MGCSKEQALVAASAAYGEVLAQEFTADSYFDLCVRAVELARDPGLV